MIFSKSIGKVLVSICTHVSPTFGSEVLYFLKFKKRLNLEEPKEFNEKLMYLKLNNYNFNKDVWQCVDKYTLRDWCIRKGLTEDNLPKILHTYTNANDINFSVLPNKFALKCTHGMGFNVICDDKSKINENEVKEKLNKWLKKKFGYCSAEVHYNHVKPRIICEEFIDNPGQGFPYDYKIYCFNGEPHLTLVCTDRKSGYKTSFYDLEWNRLHLRKKEDERVIERPESFDEMIRISKIVSKDFPFVRVDFYEHNGKAILGELTFTPSACVGEYTDEASKMLGDIIRAF